MMPSDSTLRLKTVNALSQKDYGCRLDAWCAGVSQFVLPKFWLKCVRVMIALLTLSGTLTYATTTTIDPGSTSSADLSSYSSVAVNGTYDLYPGSGNAIARTLKDVSGTGILTNSTASGTAKILTLESTANTTFSGVISGSKLNLAHTGTGTLTLTGANTYAGTTAISAGTLLITGSNTGTGTTTFGSGAILKIGNNSTTGSLAGTINTNNNGAVEFNRSNDYTYAGTISGSGTVTQAGAGTLTLSGNYTGSSTINLNSGTLKASSTSFNNGALGSSTVKFNGGTLQAGADITLRGSTSLLANGTIDLNDHAVAYYQNPISSNGTYGLSIINNGGGSGTLTFYTLGGIAASTYFNTYAGPTTIGSGVTVVGNIASSIGVTVTGTGTYDLGGVALSLIDPSGSGTIQSSGYINTTTGAFVQSSDYNAALTVTSTSDSIFSGTLDSSISGLTKGGAGTLILSGINSMTSETTTTISAGTLQIGEGLTTGSIGSNTVSNSGSLVFNRSDAYTYAGAISGTGSLTQSGASTLTLSGSNTYTGVTTISSGATLIGNISTSVGVAVTGTYDLNGTARTLIDPSSSGTIQSSTSNVALTITSTNGSTFSGTLASSINGLTKNGSGTLVLGAANNHSGDTTVSSGTLTLAHHTGASSGTIALSSGTTLKGNFASNAAIANAITITSSATLFATQDFTTTGGISGSGNLTISGSASVTFGATNTYTGTTTLQSGAVLSISSVDHLPSTTAVIMGNNASIRVTTGGFSLPALVL